MKEKSETLSKEEEQIYEIVRSFWNEGRTGREAIEATIQKHPEVNPQLLRQHLEVEDLMIRVGTKLPRIREMPSALKEKLEEKSGTVPVFLPEFLLEAPDEKLVEAYCREGVESALEILFKRYEAPLQSYTFNRIWLKDASFIDDIIQMTFLTIFKGLKGGKLPLKGKGSFKVWAYKICQNICWNENKKRAREAKPVSERYPEELPDDLAVVRPEPATNPAVFNQQREQLIRALENLESQERKLFNLKLQGLSYKQIRTDPEFQEFSLDWLKLKHYIIMKKLRTILKQEGKG